MDHRVGGRGKGKIEKARKRIGKTQDGGLFGPARAMPGDFHDAGWLRTHMN